MSPTPSRTGKTNARNDGQVEGYTVPFSHTRLRPGLVETGFWAGLAGAAVLGAVDPPLALLVGAAVIIARHRSPASS